jgi:GNAT superfamily N-acetyltransferase
MHQLVHLIKYDLRYFQKDRDKVNEVFMEWQREHYTISTDKSRLDEGMIHHFLYTSAVWAIGRPMHVVRKSIENSLCFGLYEDAQQIGFARIVTDTATVGWICDMFVLHSHRGRGLGRWLVECMMQHPDVSGLRRILLNTRDAHELYVNYAGFRPLLAPQSWLEKFNGSPFENAEKTVSPGSKKRNAGDSLKDRIKNI